MNHSRIGSFKEFSDQSFTKRIVFKEGGSVVFLLNLLPGQALPPHKHPGAQVFLLALEGEGEVIVDGRVTPFVKDDAVQSGGDEEFALRNTGSIPMSVYVILSKIPSEEYAKEM